MERSLRDTDIVVVGSGMGGLTAAAYLAALGKRVIVVDRHYVAGGNATVFNHHGYEFDIGVHYLGECQPGGALARILESLGIEVKFREMDPDGFDTLLYPDFRFRVPKGADNYRERLHEAFPDEREGVDGFVDLLVEIGGGLSGGGGSARLPDYVNTTLADVYDNLKLSPRLRAVLCAEHGTYAVPPSRASFLLHSALMMHYLGNGAWYPEGGGQVLADVIVDFIKAHGGEVILRTPVTGVIIEDGAVRGVRLKVNSIDRAAGVPEEIRAPVVLSNADLKRTVCDLVGEEHFPSDYVERVKGFRMALPLFVLYLVLDRDLGAEGYPNSNVFASRGGDPYDIEGMYAALDAGKMPEGDWGYMTFTSLKDPTNTRLCRPGQTNMQIMTLAPADYSFWGLQQGPAAGERYRLNKEYVARKKELRDSMLSAAELYIPGIADAIAFEDTATPITYERFTHASGGTSYGIECSPDQFLMNRPAPTTPVRGLFLCGASTIGGHGIIGAMQGGIWAASAIAEAPVQELVTQRLATG